MPRVAVTDNFVATDGDALDTHSPDIGGAWEHYPGYTADAIHISNALRGDGTTGYAVHTNAATIPTPDYDVAAALFVATNDGSDMWAVLGRADHSVSAGLDTYYYVAYSSEWSLSKANGGVFTSLGTFSQALSVSTGYSVILRMRGTSLKVFIDGTERISATDSAITSAFRCGLYTRQGSDTEGHWLDTFNAESDASLPPYRRHNVLLRR